jgi:hypothetical protein
MPAVGTPPDFYNQSDLIQGDMDRVTATSDYMRGDGGNIRRTATEAAMIQDAQNSRATDKLAQIEEILAECGEKLIQLLQQFMTGEQVVRVVGAHAMPMWITYDRDYIAGQFDYEVEAGSTQPRNESFRRQAALQFMDAMSPFITMGVVDPAAIARRVMQEGFGIKDATQYLMGGGIPPAPGMEGEVPGQPMPPGGAPAGPPGPPDVLAEEAPEEELIPGIPNELVSRTMLPQAA